MENEEYVRVWHGTNPKNWKAILKTGKFKMGSWFAEDEATARQYALMSCTPRMKPVVSFVVVQKKYLYYNGYYCSQKELFFANSCYTAKEDLRAIGYPI